MQLDSFRIAGGLMLFLIALDMVFEKRTQRREERAEKINAQNAGTLEIEDVSVFPMAMPMLAGPGAIASIMLLMSKANGIEGTVMVLAALFAVLLLTLAALIAASTVMGIGTGVCVVMARTLPRVQDGVPALRHANSLLGMGVLASPLLAPLIGGQLATLWSWRACHAFLPVPCAGVIL
ncbi:MarC family protein, partial [Salmonella enterica]|uniref:MarC family protein n=1 Tax=Salmonella enterica TaxID=28901 RepID=UPI002738A10C